MEIVHKANFIWTCWTQLDVTFGHTQNNRYWRYPNRGQDMYFEYKNKMHDANAILEIALIIFVVFRHVSQRSAE